MAYKGFAFIDVVSPCVTFNNHSASTKSFDYVRAHAQVMGELDFVDKKSEITVDYKEGDGTLVEMHDGTVLRLQKLDGAYDPKDADMAIQAIRKSATAGEVLTGLLYLNPAEMDLHDALGTVDRPLNSLPMSELCPGSKALEGINARLR
jgi:2-oxoglutarate/2-oxoacid ferredoxin oxidoreductase subunit beta